MPIQSFPSYIQYDITDCGPTCLRIISKYYGKEISLDTIRSLSEKTRTGTNLLGLSEAAEGLGFSTLGARITFEVLAQQAPLPCIVFWRADHFCVVYKIRRNTVYLSDPSMGLVKLSKEEFLEGWTGSSTGTEGIVLILEPTPAFEELESDRPKSQRPFHLFRRVFHYVGTYRKLFAQVLVGLTVGSLINLSFPFLTQGLIDLGIAQQDIGMIYLLLIAQLALFVGGMTIEILRRVILMHISSRVNIYLLGDFIQKLFRLPIHFFDAKLTGDILQRIGDHQRVEQLLSSGTLNILFSLFNLLIFGMVLIYYDWSIFLLFAGGSILFYLWIRFFLRKRAEIDFRRFHQLALNADKNLELIHGMQEIKLNNQEIRKRWEWSYLQAKIFQINLDGIRLDNWQNGGSSLINQLKNILITFYSAALVLEGEITLGMMLSISFIIGQMNVPLSQLLEFTQSLQDAELSMERIQDTYEMDEEAEPQTPHPIPADHSIQISHLSFRYMGMRKDRWVLQDLNLTIPQNRVTAIVGASGSGKTTLLKLLLKFYDPTEGSISVGQSPLSHISHAEWRSQIGAVMQDGFIFPDTIAQNITMTDEMQDLDRMVECAKIACIHEFIESLPMGYRTKIGVAGQSLSQGQRQRILIARAIYKDPAYLFFDEATSALDAQNERRIKEHLDQFIQGRTAVIIAHRLSTVKNADQILVLDQGQIVESGNHESLIQLQGYYYHLVKNQLEIGA
ncbi:peptidase domain-containing ABC transporter [Pontibacter sp. G13]|uniref:peptidase domain-containing ABC transporter n=1 Tax=Pontibacter sp. G13 TaxID=3074898 RepID=UPI002889FBFA|nr:peptidase domain-containing ABC transporter [Pontibacter sp. G13]WNJ17539.1 peptidase domain-containing ABC transporter [Pontibacter sp. G13]